MAESRHTGSRGPDAGRFVYSPAMVLVSGLVLALPMLALLLLLRRPDLDLTWEHHPSHFWLVLLTAALSAVLAYATGAAAERRADSRVFLVSLSFLAAAGFLGLHALATPGVLLTEPNVGFVVATPVGIALGSLFAAGSALDLSAEGRLRAVRAGRWLRLALLGAMAAWALLSLTGTPPLEGGAAAAERADGALGVVAVASVVLYAAAAGRYLQLWRRQPSLMLLSMSAAFVLLAEAMVAVVFARNWQLSWWEWHLLLLGAFALVTLGARLQWHEERFADLYLADTVAGEREISVLFADLQGFTSFSERHDAAEVATMLNTFFEVAIPPVVRRHGGDIDRIIGDALMVTFNRRGDQPDHAVRAARAGLALQEATTRILDDHPDWPRFRVGVNSGPAVVSLLGTEGGRTHTVIGDTVNVASRIEGMAPAGSVAVSQATRDLLPGAHTESLGMIELKGKALPVEVHRLVSLAD